MITETETDQCRICKKKHKKENMNALYNIALNKYIYYCKRCSKNYNFHAENQKNGNEK